MASLCIKNPNDFINEIENNYFSYTNITPNGSLAPKSEFQSQYNQLISSYNNLLISLKLDQFILKHHFPIHVRIKKSLSNKSSKIRPHATELIHSDAWAGESSNAINLHIPMWGDIEHNHMKFFMPPNSFRTDWLNHLENYSLGSSIADLYSPVDFVSSLDTAVLSDLATLHQTNIAPNAGIRISLDTTFLNIKDLSHDEEELIHQNRNSEMLDYDLFQTLGKSRDIVIKKSIKDPINDNAAFAIGYEWSLIENSQ